jgi:hypothetical protein
MTSLLSVRLALNLVGALAHAGQLGRPEEVVGAGRADERTAVAVPALVGGRVAR